MHIVHISSVHRASDPRIRLKQLASVVQAGHRASLVTGDTDALPAADGVEVFRIHPGRRRRLRRMLITSPRAVLAARRLGADLYQFHDPELLPWALLLLLSGKPVIYDIHEDNISGLRQKRYLAHWLRRPLAALLGAAEQMLAAPFRQIIAESYYARRFPAALPILNYAELELPMTPAAFDANSSALLYSGNLTRDRGAATLAQLVVEQLDLSVTSIGFCHENLAAELRALAGAAKDRLHLIGIGDFVPFERIREAYAQPWLAGVAAFPDTPHYREKELTKFFEFMAAGLPIIASDFPAWKALIVGNGVGICIPPGDAKALADAAHWLQGHPAEGLAMARRGQELVRTRYNWAAEGKRLIDFYESLVRPTTAGVR